MSATQAVASHPSQRARASRPAAVAASGKALELLSLGLLVTVVPRVLGPVDYGIFAVVTSIVTIGSVTLALGGPVLMARFVPMAPESERPALARALATRVAHWRGAVYLLVLVGGVSAALLSPTVLPPLTVLVVLAALGLDVLATILVQTALALQRVAAWSFRYPIQNLTLVAAALILGPQFGRPGILAAVLVSTGCALVAGLVAVRRMGAASRSQSTLPAGVTQFSLVQGLGSASLVVAQRAGIVALALVGSTAQAGLAGLAIGISLALSSIGIQPFVAELPRLVERWLVDAAGAEREARRLGWLALAVLSAVSAIGASLAGPILRHAVGPDYEVGREALQAALVAVPFAAALGVLTVASALRLCVEVRLTALLVGLATTLGVAALLVPDHGALGAAVAYAVGAGATAVAAAVLMPAAVAPAFVVCSLAAAGGVACIGALA